MDKIKIILTEGDSWTAGDILDPKLEKLGITSVDHRDNDEYRLPKVWPYKLSKLTNIEVSNTSHAGASNDGIEKRIIAQVGNLLKSHNASDILVIIGWTSPERKDFYYKDAMNSSDNGRWETIYPASPAIHKPADGFEEFTKLYTTYFWNAEEYIMRYMIQNINIHNYLNSHNIKHVFFDAFYETFEAKVNPNRHPIFDSVDLINVIKKLPLPIENLSIKDQYLELYETNFIKITFKQFIKNILEKSKSNNIPYSKNDLFDKMHPTELSHQKWANYLKLYFDGEV
jgi:hypothetical protein